MFGRIPKHTALCSRPASGMSTMRPNLASIIELGLVSIFFHANNDTILFFQELRQKLSPERSKVNVISLKSSVSSSFSLVKQKSNKFYTFIMVERTISRGCNSTTRLMIKEIFKQPSNMHVFFSIKSIYWIATIHMAGSFSI